MSRRIAQELLAHLVRSGVRDLVICPGSFNSPLLREAMSCAELRVQYHFEERGAAFFALGRAKRHGTPAAVCVTSGTAVAECLPAVIEAKYSGVPLVIVSADRPVRFVGTGAPQVIEQLEILRSFVQLQEDIDSVRDLAPIPHHAPSHFNVRFEEPLFDGSDDALPSPEAISVHHADRDPAPQDSHQVSESISSEMAEVIRSSRRPLVLISELSPLRFPLVRDWVTDLDAPLLVEPLSGLREYEPIADRVLWGGPEQARALAPDLVLRLGGVPVTSLWRDLERDSQLRSTPVISISDLPYPGLARPTIMAGFDRLAVLQPHWQSEHPSLDAITAESRERMNERLSLLARYPCSEAALVHRISRLIPFESALYLGNSLPIREWDLYADTSPRGLVLAANRGANGIDGQLATFAGMCGAARECWGVFGDLTFYYDLQSLALLARQEARIRVVVINNGGGRIFSHLPYFDTHFEGAAGAHLINSQSIQIGPLAQSFGFSFLSTDSLTEPLVGEKLLIEVRVDNSHSDSVRRARFK